MLSKTFFNNNMSLIYNNKYILFILLLIVSIISHFNFFYYDYHMDDAWVIGTNYLHESIFTKEGFDGALANIYRNYAEQWYEQSRFIGIFPILRFIQIYISSDMTLHLILNLIFHASNAFLMFFLLKKQFNVNNFNAFSVSIFFAISLNLSTGMYALCLWIGSNYVNLLTLFLLLYFLYIYKETYKKSFIFVNIIYFLIAFSDFSLAVIVFSLILFLIGLGYKINKLIGYSIFLILPIAINLVIKSFSPSSGYIGTKPNFNFEHILNNLINIFTMMIGNNIISQLIIGLFLLLGTIYLFVKKRQNKLNIISILSIIFGYILLFSLSSRTDFPNPYFLYIPYFGLVILITVILSELKIRKYAFILLLVFLTLFNYWGSKEYFDFRKKTLIDINNVKEEFKKIENISKSDNEQLVILLYENYQYESYPFGYHDLTFNTWREKTNKSYYAIATDYKLEQKQFLFEIGVNQYVKEKKTFMSIEEIINMVGKKNINKDKFKIIYIDRYNKINIINNLKEIKKNFILKSEYSEEFYGDGKKFLWGDGKINLKWFNEEKDLGKYLLISLNITSLFNDEIIVSSINSTQSIKLKANESSRVNLLIKIDSLKEEMNFKSDKYLIPQGDNRKLSFRIDNDIQFKVIDNLENFEIDKELALVNAKGFYDLEENSFRWVSNNAEIELPFEINLNKQDIILDLDGNFLGKYPSIRLGNKLADSVEQISPTQLRYKFINLNQSIKNIKFDSEIYKEASTDPRTLSFMFYRLILKKENK